MDEWKPVEWLQQHQNPVITPAKTDYVDTFMDAIERIDNVR